MNGEHAVIIAGAGPTGLMLAGELGLAGVDVAIVERRVGQELAGSRAGGLHSRSIEVMDQRGVAERFLAEGKKGQHCGFGGAMLDLSDCPTRHNYVLALWQKHVERILAGWVIELRVPIYRGHEVVGVEQVSDSVEVQLATGQSLRAQYLVGCDGGRSVVRKSTGIEFPGWDATVSCLLAEVEATREPPLGIRRDAGGIHGFHRLEEGPVRVMVTERQVVTAGEPSLRELSEAIIAVFGSDYGIHSPTALARFTDMSRQAAAYRDRRILLAGDAAHIHAPDGGQGLNTGVQDAVNLGWKLAQVVKGSTPPSLLDTYHAERHPVGARAIRNSMAAVSLRRPDARIESLRNIVVDLLSMDEPRKRFGAMLSGLDVCYDSGNHPLVGRRMPDLDLQTSKGATRVFALLHEARPVLLNLGQPDTFSLAPWTGRVRVVDAKCSGQWELPVLGVVTPPNAVLIRPDGHVAWVGDATKAGLTDALTTWFGPPAPAQE